MKTEWDYTELADAYLKRPDYAPNALKRLFELTNVPKGGDVCDVGAGAAHLTLELAKQCYSVFAVEPNDAMRENGVRRTTDLTNVKWFEGVGEQLPFGCNVFELVTFGSSFNVCDREQALKEAARVLKDGGWFACMWNHRVLTDPLQEKIENVIKTSVPDYGYGTRREDQTNVINASKLFGEVTFVESEIIHSVNAEDFVEAWRSHATLRRQSQEMFGKIIKAIQKITFESAVSGAIQVPYVTRIWAVQKV